MFEKIQFAEVDEDARILPAKNASALHTALTRLGVLYRYNVRAKAAEINTLGETKWRKMTDRCQSRIKEKIKEVYNYPTTRGLSDLNFGAEQWAQAFGSLLCDKELDPFAGYLYGVPSWDGVERIDGLLTAMFGADESELTRWASRYLFLGPVERAHKPGAKQDVMPVLIGPQGVGKSRFLRNILPDEYRNEWFGDGLHLAADRKTRVEALQGRVIVEAAEMAGSTRAELESLKAFLSAQDDGNVRLAYRHNPEPSPRMCIIVGTANERDDGCIPNDSTGNRRFAPVKCPRKTGNTLPDVDQLWAEAVLRYKSGACQVWMPDSLNREQSKLTEEYRRQDVIVADAIEALKPSPDGESLASLIGRVFKYDREQENRASPGDQARVKKELKAMGWEPRRVYQGTTRVRLWFPPPGA